jgi:hypothetical protein
VSFWFGPCKHSFSKRARDRDRDRDMAQLSISVGVGKAFFCGMLDAALSLARSEIWRPCMDS